MRIADAEARSLALRALKRTMQKIESAALPSGWTEGMIAFLDKSVGFRAPATGQELDGLIYVVISEANEDIEQRAEALLGPLGD